ncbi:hypothetical protein L208DRAFT_1270809 [Tricholoma matsutake]|nr:hypothetical protein L208DRAFT_1270809 [Tricholoma matsutake 945]
MQGLREDDWEEMLNPMMKRAFEGATHTTAKEMMQWDQYGLDGFPLILRNVAWFERQHV